MSIPIFDGHNDSLLVFYNSNKSFFVLNQSGDIDFPRLKQGNMLGGLFAICVPDRDTHGPRENLTIDETGWIVTYPPALEFEYAAKKTKRMLQFAKNLEQQSSQQIKIIHNYDDLTFCKDNNIIAMVLHFEGAAAIDADLSNLEEYYQQGLRSLGLVWSRPNIFGYGVPFQYPVSPDIGPGLTTAGKELVKKCNELGILIDLAHLNYKGFFDVAGISNKPLVVSHANVHKICPASRNLLDDQIDMIGKTNGLIGVFFDIPNFRADGKLVEDSPLSMIVDHIDYIVDRIGIEHVAFGSDFDGAELPNKLKSVADYPKLIQELEDRGYSIDDIEKIAYKNWFRVLKDTWQ